MNDRRMIDGDQRETHVFAERLADRVRAWRADSVWRAPSTTMSGAREYRTVLRALRQTSSRGRAARSADIARNVRKALDSGAQTRGGQDSLASVASAYVRAQKLHQDLIERYNPGSALTDAERVSRSAQRVGLNVPKTPGVAQ